jgi:predicted HicB family RNase H-like nuclease
MKDIIEFKNFVGSVHYSSEDDCFFGRLEGITDLVTFEGKSTSELKKAFKEAVEDYIEACAELGKDLFKSYKGSFNIRVSPDLHRKIANKAVKSGISLNQFVQTALEHELELQK